MTTAYLTHPRYLEHNLPGHPEHAGRIQAVWSKLEESGLASRMKRAEATPVTDAQILAVHEARYLDVFQQIALLSPDEVGMLDHDTYALSVTPEVARLAAGGVVDSVDLVLRGEADNALAAVRPPGHHAIPRRGMGFCLLGNIAIAARHAQKAYGIERVLIVDYDVHHGNGTQDMFYEDDSVLFISTHQSPFYPGTGRLEETGNGSGKGYTLNIPLPAGQGDKNYATIFEQIVWPAARRFQPGLILISAGFDAHWTDPLAAMKLTLTGYDALTRQLIAMAKELCGGKIVFVMEGGYNLEALGYGVANIARALLGDDAITDPLGKGSQRPEPDISALIQQIKALHQL
ncbi:MAG: histone deacetylase [bacterium]|nr:histone deacetylase [bacterium]